MVKKKKSVQETVTAATAEPVAVEETTSVNKIRTRLEEIATYEGVRGYILRNSTSATIDIKDPAKIIDYAILSSSALDAGKEFSELFDLGDIANIAVEGKDIRMLSLAVDESKISIFMEKNANSEKVLKMLHGL